MEQLLIIFIAVTAVAVVIQMGVLIALFVAVKKTTSQVESLTEEVQKRALPTIDLAQGYLADSRPQVQTMVANLAAATTTVKGAVERLDTHLTEFLDRAHSQATRADEFVNRTVSRVEKATETVEKKIMAPVRQVSGVVAGVQAVLEVLRRRSAHGNGAPPGRVNR